MMMDEVMKKQELSSNYQCSVCLSVGRKLTPLREYTVVFKKIVAGFDYHKHVLLESIQLCWECVAVLRRVQTLIQRAMRSCVMVQKSEYIYGSLSSLTAIVLNDTHTHTVYVYGAHAHIDTVPTQSDVLSDHFVGDECDDLSLKGDDVKNDEVTAVPVTTEPKKPKNNRWAIKRVLQNKKPKFKIITDYTEDCFNRIQIKNEDVQNYLQRERDNECFKSKKYKCSGCVEIFADDKTLKEHNKTFHDTLSSYTCDICGARMRHKRVLRVHMRTHYVTYACTLCAFTCRDVTLRKAHQLKHKRVFQCVKCELKFGSRKQLFSHHKSSHERFTCEHCGVSFKMRYCIKNHLRKQHSPFECKPCNKRFARYNGLWLHNKTTHPVSTSRTDAYCVECDRKYPDVYRYRWHLANSSKHKPTAKVRVSCPGCDKVFSKNIYMKDHYNLVHLKYYKYRCEQCDKNFIRNADLVKHKRRVHEGILPPKNKICYMCGRGFSTNKILMNHLRTHSGERPHECSVCGARFTQRTTLTAHYTNIHTKQ